MDLDRPNGGSISLGVRTTLLLLTLPLAVAGAASCRRDQKPERVAEGYLFEKGPYQGFYDGGAS
jgi:hypothetical protein